MKKQLLTAVLAGLAVLAITLTNSDVGGAGEDRNLPPAAPSGIDARMITGLIYAGRADSALTVLSSPEYATSPDPMIYLLRSRAMRDLLADEDDNKDLISDDIEPILLMLDDAVELCDRALDRERPDPIYLYYRGRAKLAKAQLYTLTRSYWGAGRNGAGAKGDLDEYLEYFPDDPDAQGDLGAFLYFADTLPGVVKFLSKLLFIPSGDRERGLQMIQYAATHNAIFEVDYQIALAAIDLLFEGQFQRGAEAMRQLMEKYPGYTRLVEPFGVMAPLAPFEMREYERLEDKMVATRMEMGEDLVDWSLVKRMQLQRAYNDIYFRSPSNALSSFTAFIDDPIERPDWALPLALVNRGQLYAKSGRTDLALQDLTTVLSTDSMSHFHDLADKMVESLAGGGWKIVDLDDLSFVGSIYDNDLEAAKQGLDEYGREYGRDVIYYFYLGEIAVFRQNFAGAQRAFKTCLKVDVKGGDQSYQMFACLRLAELLGQQRDYDKAEQYAEKAIGYMHAGYLFDFMMHSRKQYYGLLKNGTIKTPPAPLIERSAARSAEQGSAEQSTEAHN